MSIKNCQFVLTLPAKPFNTEGVHGWKEIEDTIGTKFPSDYKQFISLYGTGGIDDFLWILTPFVNDENVNLIANL